jgi:hypothetical protein
VKIALSTVNSKLSTAFQDFGQSVRVPVNIGNLDYSQIIFGKTVDSCQLTVDSFRVDDFDGGSL